MYFGTKNYLKSNRYHTAKQAYSLSHLTDAAFGHFNTLSAFFFNFAMGIV
jgi:hypothetical protein